MKISKFKLTSLLVVSLLVGGAMADSRTFLQLFQIVTQDVLTVLGLDTATDMRTVSTTLDKELDSPLRMYGAVPTADSKLYFSSNQVEKGNGSLQSSAPADDILNIYPATNIDFLTSIVTGGTVTRLGGAYAIDTCSAGQFNRVVFSYLSASNSLDTTTSGVAASVPALTNPGALFAALDGTPVGYIDLECVAAGNAYKTAGSATDVIETKVGADSRIIQFGSGSGSGAGGDTSFKLQSVTGGLATLKKGFLILSDGRELGTYVGSGTTEVAFNSDILVGLTAAFGGNQPTTNTQYILAIDLLTLPAAIEIDETKRTVYPIVSTNFVVLEATTPESLDKSLYVPIAALKPTSNVWNGTVETSNFALRTHQIPSVVINPVKFTLKQSVGSVGSVANAQGPLVNGDFTTIATSAYYGLEGDANKTGGTLGDAVLLKHDTTDPVFTSKGFFGRENVVTFTKSNDDRLASIDAFFNPGDTTDWTMSAWVFMDWQAAVTGGQYPISNWSSTGSDKVNWSFNITTDGTTINFQTTTGAGGVTIAQVSTGGFGKKWHFVGITYNSTSNTFTAWVDGNSVGSVVQIAQATTPNLLLLGGLNSVTDANDCECSIQDFSFEHRELSKSEMNARYSKRFTNHQQIAGGHVLTNDSFPFANLTGKVSYWNLDNDDGATILDDSVNGIDLTKVGSVTFDGQDLFGGQTAAVFNVDTESLTSASSSLEKDAITISMWVAQDDWSVGVTSHLFSIGQQNDFYGAYAFTNSNKIAFIVGDGGTGAHSVEYVNSFINGKYVHLAFTYTNQKASIYVNGEKVASANVPFPLVYGTSGFKLASDGTTRNFKGRISNLSISDALTDEDIKKLASAKITHTVTTPPEHQEWIASYTREDSKITNEFDKGFLLDKKLSSVYIDPGLNSGDVIEMKMKDTGFSPTVIPVQKFNRFYSSDPCVGVECSLAHDLPGRPANVEVWHEIVPGKWERQDASTCQATATDLVCLFSAITLIDATHRLNVIASMSDLASAFVGDPITTGAQTFSGAKEWTGLTTASGGIAGSLSSIPAGQRGEYKDAVATSSTITTAADTYVDVIGMSITLEPGVWLIGYDATLELSDISGGSSTIRGSLVISDAANTVLPKTAGYIAKILDFSAGSASASDSVSRSTVIVIGSTTTYKLRVRSSLSDTAGTSRIYEANITGSFTDPDNSSNIWALRL